MRIIGLLAGLVLALSGCVSTPPRPVPSVQVPAPQPAPVQTPWATPPPRVAFDALPGWAEADLALIVDLGDLDLDRLTELEDVVDAVEALDFTGEFKSVRIFSQGQTLIKPAGPAPYSTFTETCPAVYV